MSINDEMRARLKSIRQDERRSKDHDQAAADRQVAWLDYIESLYQLSPDGAPNPGVSK